ncbi:MAG: CxxH/CxxC protein, partial [Turicibacter sp.]
MYCCLEHVEDVMDRYIDEKEVIPVLFKLEENDVHKCD